MMYCSGSIPLFHSDSDVSNSMLVAVVKLAQGELDIRWARWHGSVRYCGDGS